MQTSFIILYLKRHVPKLAEEWGIHIFAQAAASEDLLSGALRNRV
jgi:hypothetical protein